MQHKVSGRSFIDFQGVALSVTPRVFDPQLDVGFKRVKVVLIIQVILIYEVLFVFDDVISDGLKCVNCPPVTFFFFFFFILQGDWFGQIMLYSHWLTQTWCSTHACVPATDEAVGIEQNFGMSVDTAVVAMT